MNICWKRIRPALAALACVGLSGCNWVLLDSKGDVGIAQRDLILICIALMLIVVIPAIVLTFFILGILVGVDWLERKFVHLQRGVHKPFGDRHGAE